MIERPNYSAGHEMDGPHERRRGRYLAAWIVFWFLALIASLAGFIACVGFTIGALLRHHGFI